MLNGRRLARISVHDPGGDGTAVEVLLRRPDPASTSALQAVITSRIHDG